MVSTRETAVLQLQEAYLVHTYNEMKVGSGLFHTRRSTHACNSLVISGSSGVVNAAVHST